MVKIHQDEIWKQSFLEEKMFMTPGKEWNKTLGPQKMDRFDYIKVKNFYS